MHVNPGRPCAFGRLSVPCALVIGTVASSTGRGAGMVRVGVPVRLLVRLGASDMRALAAGMVTGEQGQRTKERHA